MCACMQRREDPGRPEAPKLFSLLAVFVTASDAFVHQNSCAHLARLSNLAGDLYEVDLFSRVGISLGPPESESSPVGTGAHALPSTGDVGHHGPRVASGRAHRMAPVSIYM